MPPNDYREYLTTELEEKLVKGKTYNISFMVNLPEEVEYAMNNFSVLFTENKLRLSTSKNIKFKKILKNRKSNFKSISTSKYVNDESSWHKVSTTIVANGYEQFMTIGNFSNNKNTSVQSVRKKSRKSSYYFIDMVSVEKEKPFSLDEFYIFENFTFDLDKVDFEQKASEQLNRLVLFLEEHPTIQIDLKGYTCASGSTNYNKKLSSKRAKRVAMFLVENGLNERRIKWKGLGEKNPIADNITNDGKIKNRRVEFILTDKKYKNYASNTFEDE